MPLLPPVPKTPRIILFRGVCRKILFRFFFCAGDRDEPAHTHVERDDAEAKFWLAPARLAWNRGFSSVDLRRLEKLTQEHEARLPKAWHDYSDINQ
jgi:hypothetical protein